MGDGWETRRRRAEGNDWLIVRLAAAGVVRLAGIDTLHYKGNAPGAASLSAIDARRGELSDPGGWSVLLPRTPLQPDTDHRLLVDGGEATHVRLDIFPDGGVARLRLFGSVTGDGLAGLERRWRETG
jgi:allantoicase